MAKPLEAAQLRETLQSLKLEGIHLRRDSWKTALVT